MSRGLCIIPTCHPDPANLGRLCEVAQEAELTPFVVWQGTDPGTMDANNAELSAFARAGVPGEFWWGPLGKGGAVKAGLVGHAQRTGQPFRGLEEVLSQPWLVVDGDLTTLGPEPLTAAVRLAEHGHAVRGRFDTYGRLTRPVAALLWTLGYPGVLGATSALMAHLWTSAVQAYPAAALTWERLYDLPDGYGWDVAAAHLMERRFGPVAAVDCGPKDHRQTDRAHLARVLGEVAAALGAEAPAWSE